MTYAFVQDLPIDQATYEKVRADLGDEFPKGLVSHVAFDDGSGLKYVDVWDTQDDWDRFYAERLQPAIGRVLAESGQSVDPAQVRRDAITVIDTWTD